MSPLTHVEDQVLQFHFAELPADERAVVEAHLRGCPACVGAFLEVKRHAELAEESPRPSPAARARLRAAVAAEVLPARASWERPMAFALGLAAALLAASVVGSLSHVEPPVRGALVR